MIRSILCPISGGSSDRGALDAAAVIARRFAAHVDVLHAKADPTEIAPFLGEGMSPALIGQIIDDARDRADRLEAAARSTFDTWAREHSISVNAVPAAVASPSCAWTLESGAHDRLIGQAGRLADMTVLPSLKVESSVGATLAFEASLLDSGKPVLLAAESDLVLDGVVIVAWNGSPEAGRALTAALPLLSAAREVRIVSVEETGRRSDPDAARRYLAWHRIAATTRMIAGKGTTAAAAIAAECESHRANVLVMGGYTHSRIRELIFGGVTAQMIRDGSRAVLLAH